MRFSQALKLSSALCVTACSSQHARRAAQPLDDAGGDAMSAHAGSRADAGSHVDAGSPDGAIVLAEDCPSDVVACPPKVLVTPWQTLLRASDFGAGARFEALGGGALLVRHRDGSQEVAQLARDLRGEGTPPPRRWSLQSGNNVAVDVADVEDADQPVYALSCNLQLRACSVMVGDQAAAALRPLPGATLVAGQAGPDSLVLVRASPVIPCVLADGVSCWVDGQWQQLAETSVRFVAGAISDRQAVAVAEDGELWLASGAQTSTLPRLEPSGLYVVGRVTSVQLQGLARADIVANGQLLKLDSSSELTGCTGGNSLGASYGSPRWAMGTVRPDSSRVIYGYFEGRHRWCSTPAGELSGAILEYGEAPCNDAPNPRVLTADALSGEQQCVFVD